MFCPTNGTTQVVSLSGGVSQTVPLTGLKDELNAIRISSNNNVYIAFGDATTVATSGVMSL